MVSATSQRKKTSIGLIALTILLFLVGILFISPFVFMLSSSFKPSKDIMRTAMQLIPQNFTTQNYYTVFNTPLLSFGTWYKNTIVMAVVTIIFKTAIVTLTGYAFAKISFKGRNAIFLVLLSALMIPGDIMLIPRYMIFSRIGITDSMWSMVLPYSFDIYFVFLIRQFFITIPDSITEAAEIDGCNHLQIYWKIVMPLAIPAIITMVLFTFVWAWNDYMMPYIFINDMNKQMLSVGMQLFTTGSRQNYGAQMAAAILILMPVIVVFLFSQRFFIEGIATTGIKG